MSELKQKSVQVFLDELASKAATPGGGSAAALLGAQSAALVSMVCNLTIGKPKYAEVEAEMTALLQKSEALRATLTAMIQADVNVFDSVMAAYGLPRSSDDEKAVRAEAIQAALKDATKVTLDCAKACVEALVLSRVAAEKGNVNVVSDAGVAVMAGYGALRSAALNVYINAGGVKDKAFSEACIAELEEIMSGAEQQTKEIYDLVKSKL